MFCPVSRCVGLPLPKCLRWSELQGGLLASSLVFRCLSSHSQNWLFGFPIRSVVRILYFVPKDGGISTQRKHSFALIPAKVVISRWRSPHSASGLLKIEARLGRNPAYVPESQPSPPTTDIASSLTCDRFVNAAVIDCDRLAVSPRILHIQTR